MQRTGFAVGFRFLSVAMTLALATLAACSQGKPPEPPQSSAPAAGAGTSPPGAGSASPAAPAAPAPAPAADAAQPAPRRAVLGTWKGDLDGMTERRLVRILVPQSKTFYFLDKGQQRGISYDLGIEFEKHLNATLRDRTRPIRVVFIPTARSDLAAALDEGRGDIAVGNLVVTPERLQRFDFSAPFLDDRSEILVTARGTPAPATPEGLAGGRLYVRKGSIYDESIQALNARLKTQGKKPVEVVPLHESLEDEDVLEMVNAGLVPATIVDNLLATFWKQIFENIELHPAVRLREGSQVGWAMRKGSPKLKASLDAFVAKNRKGTAMGNMLLKRYLASTKWVRNSTATEDMRRFAELRKYFETYAGKYDFDWLLVAAQAYQESRLDQRTRSPVGAIGVMQVMPATANDKSVGIPDIHVTDRNVEAGVKYLRFLVNEYFDEPGIGRLDRHLFAFAAYNAGPNRIARLRTKAAGQGLDPNKWFNNVELVVAEDVGRETVQYVSNIFKYYIAYTLVLERQKAREAAKRSAPG